MAGCGCLVHRFHRHMADRRPAPSTTAVEQADRKVVWLLPVVSCPTAGCGSPRRSTSVAKIEPPPSCRSPARASCRDRRRRASANPASSSRMTASRRRVRRIGCQDPTLSDDIPDCSPESRRWRQRRAATINTRLTASPPLWIPASDLWSGNVGRGAGQVTIRSQPPDVQRTVDIASGCAGSPRVGPGSHVALTRPLKGWTFPLLRSCIRGAR